MVEALGCGKLAKGFQTVSKLNPRRVCKSDTDRLLMFQFF